MVQLIGRFYTGKDVRYLRPSPTVGSLFQACIQFGHLSSFTVQPFLMGRYDSGHTFVQSRLLRPKKPILYCGTESIDVEPRYQRRIQVRQLILLAVIDSRD